MFMDCCNGHGLQIRAIGSSVVVALYFVDIMRRFYLNKSYLIYVYGLLEWARIVNPHYRIANLRYRILFEPELFNLSLWIVVMGTDCKSALSVHKII